MRNIAIIPARSGSKGLKNKNIKLLEGKPLLTYTIEAAQLSQLFSCIHVSTDSEEYAKIAKEYGADVPFLRDRSLSDDHADTWEVLRWVIEKYKETGMTFDTVTLLQPTSPLRDDADIKQAYQIFCERQADSVISVCEEEHSPELCNTLGEGGSMLEFIDTKKIGRRQDFLARYRLNGAIYMQTKELLMNGKNLYGPKSYAYVMNKENSVDIDDEFDFIVAAAAMKFKHQS